MFVLIMGHRRGLSKALEKMGLPYGLWSANAPVNKLKTEHIIVAPFEVSKELALNTIKDLPPITHIIAGTEESVVPASNLRLWTGARRNNHSTVIRCVDKLRMKEHLFKKEIPMTDFLDSKNDFSNEEIFERLGTPIISKKRYSSGGRALERITDPKALTVNSAPGRILEKAIKGTEGSVESFVLDGEVIFTNITRYAELGAVNIVPGDYPSKVAAEVLELNQKVIKALKLEFGITHLEFYVTKDGVLFGEIANRPPGGYIMDCLRLAYGFDPWEALVAVELGQKPEFSIEAQGYAASIVLPKSQGRVRKIEGEELAKKLDTLKKLKIKVTDGDEVSERAGVGDDLGHALFSAGEHESLLRGIQEFQKTFSIKIDGPS